MTFLAVSQLNDIHLQFLAGPEWERVIQTELMPWVDSVVQLGDHVLEVGPGPGLTTDYLRQRAAHVTAVEIDKELADALAARLQGSNVTVVHADAGDTGLSSSSFSSATCFTMLHHVPTPEDQDRLFTEVNRLLRPGAPFVAVDSMDDEMIRLGHVDDIFVPVDPQMLPARLSSVGFTDVDVEVTTGWAGRPQFRATARKAR